MTEGRCAYLILKQDGELVWGESLLKLALASPHGYASSDNAELVRVLSHTQRSNARAKLKYLGQKYEWLIFSSESWGPKAHLFGDDWLFADPAFEIHLLAYIRPQIEWLNSAWWQWGAWTRMQPRPWFNRMRKNAQWHPLLKQWKDKLWVNSLTVRLMDGDIVCDAMNYLGYELPEQPRVHQGLPAIVLRLFQRHRHLRPGPHASAIDFVLARHLELEAKGTPWVIGPGLVKELVDFFREDNQKLAQMLTQDQGRRLLDDPRWWKAEAYDTADLEKALVAKLDMKDLETFSVAAMKAIDMLDAEVRRLRADLAS